MTYIPPLQALAPRLPHSNSAHQLLRPQHRPISGPSLYSHNLAIFELFLTTKAPCLLPLVRRYVSSIQITFSRLGACANCSAFAALKICPRASRHTRPCFRSDKIVKQAGADLAVRSPTPPPRSPKALASSPTIPLQASPLRTKALLELATQRLA